MRASGIVWYWAFSGYLHIIVDIEPYSQYLV